MYARNVEPLGEHAAEFVHHSGGDDDVGVCCALQSRPRHRTVVLAANLIQPAQEGDRIAAGREKALRLRLMEEFDGVKRQRVELNVTFCGKRPEVRWRHEARRVSACSERACQRDGRLGVATRTESKHGDIHGRMRPNATCSRLSFGIRLKAPIF